MSKILVVDDDKNILAAFKQMLGEQGYDVSRALHAQEALNLIREQKPDLVIMDVRMPGLSGLEALRKIKEVDRDLSEGEIRRIANSYVKYASWFKEES